jgi:hypothetical protein
MGNTMLVGRRLDLQTAKASRTVPWPRRSLVKDKRISPMRIPWERPIAVRHVTARASMWRSTETFTAWLVLYVATTAGFASADAA